jgi:hypothetical protein
MFEKTFSFWRRLVGQSPAHAEKPGATATEDDRRLWVRYAAELQGNVQLGENEAHGKVVTKVRDLSLGGANLTINRPLELGQMLSVELPLDDNEVFTVLACVVRVKPQPDGNWSVGCVFARELTSEDLDRVGAQKVPASTDDQRTWVRFACSLTASYRQVSDVGDEAHEANILNISPNGVGLAVQHSLAAGSLLNVDLVDSSGRIVRTLLACVVHTTSRSEGGFAVGCNFIRELSEEELDSML